MASKSSYGEGVVWNDDDAAEFSAEVPSKKIQRVSYDASMEKMDDRIGANSFKPETMTVPFGSSFRIGALKDIKSITFSTANKNINPNEISTSKKSVLFGASAKSAQFCVVTAVSVDNLSNSFGGKAPLVAEFPNIKASASHHFAAAATTDDRTVRFTVVPGTSSRFEREVDEAHLAHTKDYPGLDKAFLDGTYGALGKNKAWIDTNAPQLGLLDESKISEDENHGFLVYDGPVKDVENAAGRVLALQTDHVAYSDLSPGSLSVTLSVPPKKEFNEKTGDHDTKQPTFYDYIKEASRAYPDKPVKKEQEETYAALKKQFDDKFVYFGGNKTITFYHSEPKFEVVDQ